MQEKELFLWTEKAADTEGRRITAAVSSEAIDRDSEIITADAMKKAMTEFMKNPVILVSHSHHLDSGVSPVIGRVLSWYQQGKKTFCEIEFADTPLGLQYWQLYKDKFQKAFSIGFNSNPQKQERRTIDGKTVLVHNEIELYEISAVAVPANPEALSKAAKRRQEFVDRKRQGLTKEDELFFSAIKKWDDFEAGKLDGISPDELKILEDLDQKAVEFTEYIDSPECAASFDETDYSGNAPGCPIEDDYFPIEKGVFDGDLFDAGVSKAADDDIDEEPDYF